MRQLEEPLVQGEVVPDGVLPAAGGRAVLPLREVHHVGDQPVVDLVEGQPLVGGGQYRLQQRGRATEVSGVWDLLAL